MSDQKDPSTNTLRRFVDVGDGVSIPATIASDGSGNTYDRSNPMPVEIIETGFFFGGFLVDELGSSQMAGDWRFTGTPVEVHNGTDNAYWTGVIVTGGSVTFDDSTRAFDGTKSILIANMSNGDIFDLDAPGPVDVSGYVALEIRVWVAGNYLGDVITVEGWDGAATVGTPVNLADYIQEDQVGGWQSAIIPREDLGFDVSGTITAIRVRQGVKVGPAPTLSLDAIKFQEAGGARVFSVSAPPGTRIHIIEVSISLTDVFTLVPTTGSAKGLPPLGFMSLPSLANGILAAQMINGAFLGQGVVHNFRDVAKFGFKIEDPLTDGTDTSVSLTHVYNPPIIVEGDPLLNSFEFIFSDDIALTDAEISWTGRIELI